MEVARHHKQSVVILILSTTLYLFNQPPIDVISLMGKVLPGNPKPRLPQSRPSSSAAISSEDSLLGAGRPNQEPSTYG